MTGYAGRRLITALFQAAAVLVVVFALTALLPGDTAAVILGEHATEQQVAVLRQQLGLDHPLHVRFLDWVGGLLHGDLGTSLLTGTPVLAGITDDIATTALLTSLTLVIVIPLALVIGVVSGLREGSRLDRALNVTTVLLNSVPEFALALLLIGVLAIGAGWLPATAAGLSGWSLLAYPAVLVLPVTVLAGKQLCALSRQIRIGVAESSNAAYAVHARLLGLPERTVVSRHVLVNALGPATQQLARTVDGLLGGVIVIEALFALPGMGAGFLEAVRARDLPTVQGYALVFALTTVVVNLLADLATHRLVPQREVC